jgi:hypothetical protein
MDIPVYVLVDPIAVLTIKNYALAEPKDAYRASADYPKWFAIHLLGPSLGIQWVEGG